jgi:FG-GAP-like repeat/ASPIC and UnbV
MKPGMTFLGAALVLGLALSLCVVGGSVHAAERQVDDDGHERMVATLAEIARGSRESNLYTGDAQARAFRALAADPRFNGAPQVRWRQLRLLGSYELRLGNTEEAVRDLTEAAALLPRLGSSVRSDERERAQFERAVAFLRLGESRNCVARHTSESCILPIGEAGVHQDQDGSRRGIAELEGLLAGHPDHLVARWLLNIAYMTIGGYAEAVPPAYRIPPPVFTSAEPFPRFTDVASAAGLNSMDLAGGVAIDDFDGDAVLDVVVSSSDPDSGLRYFAGRGDGTFRERSREAGFEGITGGWNVVQADYDNDGATDILVLRGAWLGRAGQHPKSLLRNDGHARFRDVTFAAGLGAVHYPSQTGAWADYDNDGDLDLYVGNEAEDNFPFPAQLFRNRGDGTFVDVAGKAGVTNDGFAKGVAWGDFDADGFQDLYVSNHNGPNRLYRNRGDGSFIDIAAAAGVTAPRSSLAVATGDFDNDGVLDLFVGATTPEHDPEPRPGSDGLAPLAAFVASTLGLPTDAETGRLYRGLGGARFEDVTTGQGLGRVLLSGGLGVGDLDGDGFLDLYVGTAYPRYEGLMPNVLYRNRGGRGFADVTTNAGVGHLQKAGGIAIADLDGDGDQDVFVNAGGMFRGDRFGDVMFANPGSGAHWLDVRLVGRRANRSAIGARLRAEVIDGGRARSIYRVVGSGGSFGANPLRQWFGLGKAKQVGRLEITWPGSGRVQVVRNLRADQRVEIVEPASSANLPSESIPPLRPSNP